MLWLPAILGWGLPAYLVRRRLDGPIAATAIDLIEPLAGLALLGGVVTLANLFTPVGGIFAPLLVIGWLGLAARLKWAGLPRITLAQVLGALLVLMLAAFLCRGLIENYDTGLYHAQTIEWFRTNVTPLGLANLHGRLGFVSSWLAVAAVVELPFTPELRTYYFILPAALFTLWGMAAGKSLRLVLISGAKSPHDFFLGLTPIAFFSETLTGNLPSPAPDLAVLVLSFFVVYLGLRTLVADSARGSDWWGLVVLAVFTLTVKLSAAPWLLLPALVWWLTSRRGQVRSRGPAFAFAVIAALVIAIPWLVRGVILSGCLAFPAPFTCLYPLPWAVPPNLVVRETVWVMSSARLPHAPMVGVVSSLTWLPAWFARVGAMPDVRILVALAIIGLDLVALTRLIPLDHASGQLRAFAVVGLVCVIGISYWTVMAPEPRFGAGFLWSAGLLPLALGLSRLLQGRGPGTGKVPRLLYSGFAGLALLVLVLAAASAILRRAAPLLTRQQSIWVLAPIVAPPFSQVTTLTGDILNQPSGTDQCWLIPLPCTPFASEELRLVRRPDGQVVAIYR